MNSLVLPLAAIVIFAFSYRYYGAFIATKVARVDPSRPTGVNNMVLPGTAMPHVLWEREGPKEAVYDGESDAQHNAVHKRFKEFRSVRPGTDSAKEFDEFVRDTVNFLDYIGEPMQLERRSIGLRVLTFLLVFFLFAYFLKKEYWKDVK